MPRDRIPSSFCICNPGFPWLVHTEGISLSHGNNWDGVCLWLSGSRDCPRQKSQVTCDVVYDIFARRVQKKCRQGESLALGLVSKFVPVHAKDAQHARKNGELRLHRILIGNRFWSQGQSGNPRPSINQDHQLGTPHHGKEVRGFFVVNVWGRKHVLIIIERQRHHGTCSAVDVEAQFGFDKRPNQGAHCLNCIFKNLQW
mmetsp:Transcript_61214/g.96901  ORF Transcript_61214/g.96901 Transcript_61214/m.96901 type:complete len:200 (-) Transcript_61214:142-741(-)